MIKFLVNIGLGLIPFVAWHGMDTRTPKDNVALFLCLAIVLFTLYQGKLKKFDNKYLLIFICYLVFSINLAPPFTNFKLFFFEKPGNFIILNKDITHLWSYKSFAFFIIYILTMISIASIQWIKKDINLSFTVISTSGLIMSIYIFFQYFGMDQFYSVKPGQHINAMTNPHLTGTMGNSTIVSPYIGMCVAFALYLKRYFWVGLMSIAVILTESKVAMAGTCISILFYSYFSQRNVVRGVVVLFISFGLLITCFSIMEGNIKDFTQWFENQSSGRVEAWTNTIDDFRNPPMPYSQRIYNMTGFGPGAYYYVHSERYKDIWAQAHNEPLELLLYENGIIGFIIMVMALLVFIRKIYGSWNFYGVNRREIRTLLASFICVCFCSLGTFVFRIAPIAFTSVFCLGLLNNPNLIEKELGENHDTVGF